MVADPTLRGIPVVVSSMHEAAIAERCAGYVTFMRKPFRLPELLDVVGRVLGGGDGLAP